MIENILMTLETVGNETKATQVPLSRFKCVAPDFKGFESLLG